MTSSSSFPRSGLAAALAGCVAVLIAGCAAKPKYRSVTYQDQKLATPPHNLSPAEYPFDDDGTYRKDWVANPSSAKRSSRRRSVPAPTVAASPPAERAPSLPPPSVHAASRPPAPPPAPAPQPRSAPPPAPKPAAARYHTVVKGDTLYSISRRYGVTVPKLKSVNGLTSDTIRIGQTLRMP